MGDVCLFRGRLCVRAYRIACLTVLSPMFIFQNFVNAGAIEGSNYLTDFKSKGPLSYLDAEYHLPSQVDPLILSDRKTELWAHVWVPQRMDAQRSPLVVFLHGNHGTCGKGTSPRVDSRCDYTTKEVCPAGYTVVPNHLGYRYAAEKLASWGYTVVSINANLGITCSDVGVVGDSALNLARGRLVLRHLALLSDWNKNGAPQNQFPLAIKDKLDFDHVGLMGHSRGGEGVRAAYNLFNDANNPFKPLIGVMHIQGIFEIAPVDRQSNRILDADGTSWTVLLPMCDGDVSNLQGIRPFDRMLAKSSESPFRMKASLLAWGTNHNFYNTEWQTSDSAGCYKHKALFPQSNGSLVQQDIAASAMMAFFRANVGKDDDNSFNEFFDPYYKSNAALNNLTQIDHEFVQTPNANVSKMLDHFDQDKGINTYGYTYGLSQVTANYLQSLPFHERKRLAVKINWATASDQAYLETYWTAVGQGLSVNSYKTFDFSIARDQSMSNIADPTDLSIQLIGADAGVLSDAVAMSRYLNLIGPVGSLQIDYYSRSKGTYSQLNNIFQTVRIPLTDFKNIDLSKIRGVRFVFNRSQQGSILFSHARFSTSVSLAKLDDEFDALLPISPDDNDDHVTPAATTSHSMATTDLKMTANHFLAQVAFQAAPLVLRRDLLTVTGRGWALKKTLSVDELEKLHHWQVRSQDQEGPNIRLPIVLQEPMQIGALQPTLVIGDHVFTRSTHNTGDIRVMTFHLTLEEYLNLPENAEAAVYYGDPAQSHVKIAAGKFIRRGQVLIQ